MNGGDEEQNLSSPPFLPFLPFLQTGGGRTPARMRIISSFHQFSRKTHEVSSRSSAPGRRMQHHTDVVFSGKGQIVRYEPADASGTDHGLREIPSRAGKSRIPHHAGRFDLLDRQIHRRCDGRPYLRNRQYIGPLAGAAAGVGLGLAADERSETSAMYFLSDYLGGLLLGYVIGYNQEYGFEPDATKP